MQKVKVLHIITRLIRGGAEHNTLLSVKGLAELGYDVSLAAGPSDKKEGDIELDVRQAGIKLRVFHNLVREISPLNDLMAFFGLYLFIKKERFDIVHTHVSKAGILGRWAAKLAGVPFIFHTTHGNYFYGYFNPLLTCFFIILERMTALITDKMITLTEVEQSQYLEQKIGKPSQYTTIHSGIDLNQFNPENIKGNHKDLRRVLGLHEDDFVVGSVGRIAPIKGHEYLIQAAPSIVKKIPRAKFLIVGDGPMRYEMEALATQLGLDEQVFFLGMREDVPELLSIMDAFVLPSRNEGMGRALVEAMAMGLPCVATSVGGVPEVVTDGETGLLVPAEEPKALAEAITRLAKDAELSKRLAQAAQRRALSAFGAQTMVNQISAVYQNFISHR